MQRAIDEAKAEEEAAKPRLENPAITAAQQDGREVYTRYIMGKWAPQDRCNSAAIIWEFGEDFFKRPNEISVGSTACKLAVTEALNDGSLAVAGYCPRLELEDEAVLISISRQDAQNIIIPGVGGGALIKCSE
ncbi:MAG: hypothetical protein V3U82_02615 [Robiginitomaculum sp.]